MPPSSKRAQRARREVVNKNVDIIDSSPSRPAKRRKKVEEPIERSVPESTKLPRDRSGISLSDEGLIAAVVPFLAMPPHFVQASRDHANSLHEKHSKEGVQAYAKLAGKDWTFYVKNLRNKIGRPPEQSNISPQVNGDGLTQSLAEDQKIHIDLGPSKMISRFHAEIYFDTDLERWNIHVNGRNGIRINNEAVRRGENKRLISGQVIEIGGVEMMFVLPEEDGSLKIHKRYLQRAALLQTDDETDDLEYGAFNPATSNAPRGQNASNAHLPIAPAPPDYRRPGTPVSARTKAPHSIGKSPAYTNGGTILMNSEDVDLSLDAYQHIKPSYSYAQLITQAISDTGEERLNLNGIYNFITDKYAYYRHQPPAGWQNSIRHNLSLNKAFEKVPRSTDEPGKGMKWLLVPEYRDEMLKTCFRGGRGGHRGSSAPGTPASLGYLRSRDMIGGDLSSAQKRSPSPRSPQLNSSYPSNRPQSTPDRGPRTSATQQEHGPGDGSPLPRHRRPQNNALGISDNISGSPPALPSSYLQEESNSFNTPAPKSVHPRLAPPSTAQRPSQHMPTSSPAPFWRFADIGNTPMQGPSFDSSPIREPQATSAVPPSSSPAPVHAPSPIRTVSAATRELPHIEELDDEDQGFDLAKGFQSIGAYHAPVSHGLPVASAVNGHS